jgi:hypothetical protein
LKVVGVFVFFQRRFNPHQSRKTPFIPIIFIIYYNVLKKHIFYNTESEGLDAGEKVGLSPIRSCAKTHVDTRNL